MQCKIQKLSVTPSRLWWVHSTCKKKNYLWRRNVQQENKKDRSWLLFLFLPENSITTSTRLAQAIISVGLIGGYHTYVNTHYWQINSIIFIIDSSFFRLYPSFPHIIIKGGIFTQQKRHIPIRFGIFYWQKKACSDHALSHNSEKIFFGIFDLNSLLFFYLIWTGFKSFIV